MSLLFRNVTGILWWVVSYFDWLLVPKLLLRRDLRISTAARFFEFPQPGLNIKAWPGGLQITTRPEDITILSWIASPSFASQRIAFNGIASDRVTLSSGTTSCNRVNRFASHSMIRRCFIRTVLCQRFDLGIIFLLPKNLLVLLLFFFMQSWERLLQAFCRPLLWIQKKKNTTELDWPPQSLDLNVYWNIIWTGGECPNKCLGTSFKKPGELFLKTSWRKCRNAFVVKCTLYKRACLHMLESITEPTVRFSSKISRNLGSKCTQFLTHYITGDAWRWWRSTSLLLTDNVIIFALTVTSLLLMRWYKWVRLHCCLQRCFFLS